MQRIKNIYYRLTQRFGARPTQLGLVLLSAALIYLGFSLVSISDVVVEEVPMTVAARTVSLYTISAAGNGTAVRTADGNAFIVRAESGGRVERMAKVGDIVARGAIVAQVENSTQRAAVLQAQGAYEAAQAGASVSDIGNTSAINVYNEAATRALTTYRTAFASADTVLRGTVDDVFSQPDSRSPGVRINSGRPLILSKERVALETIFTTWGASLQTISSENVPALLDTAESNAGRLRSFIETLSIILADDQAMGPTKEQGDELDTLRTDFAEALQTINATLQTISNARAAYVSAESAKEQSGIAGTTGTVSLASAQVKQALGVLESARAALEKTSVKTPIAGTVTAASISVGDIISIGSDVVFVASDETVTATEGTATVPLTSVKFTPSKAYVFTVNEGKLVAHEVKTGSVTSNSIAISGTEGITAIVLDVRGLKDGDAVVTQ